ncbi:hypothetical protein K438DRAFT_1777824 [Mycena galopus ATCC 62051]|nr:hypothetical protein K438DRAFT_1777824 [Mycena galopus ATCC 62051]
MYPSEPLKGQYKASNETIENTNKIDIGQRKQGARGGETAVRRRSPSEQTGRSRSKGNETKGKRSKPRKNTTVPWGWESGGPVGMQRSIVSVVVKREVGEGKTKREAASAYTLRTMRHTHTFTAGDVENCVFIRVQAGGGLGEKGEEKHGGMAAQDKVTKRQNNEKQEKEESAMETNMKEEGPRQD